MPWLCASLLSAMLLSACAIPQVAPPSYPLNPAVQAADEAARAAAGEWPGAHWWQALGDRQLDVLIDQALRDAPSLQAAQARIAQALATTAKTRASTQPQLQADGKFTYNRFTERQFVPPPYAGNFYWVNQAVLDASFDLDLWGKHRQALKAAHDNARAQVAERDEAGEALVSSITDSYIQLALLHAERDLLARTLQRQHDILGLARQRLKAGLGTELDVAQSESLLPATRSELDDVDGRLALMRLQLAALAGQGPDAAAGIARPSLRLERVLSAPEVIPARWVGRRPDVMAGRWRVESSGYAIEAARLDFFPDLNLSAFAGFQAIGWEDLISKSALQYGVAPAISLPLFDGGRRQATLDTQTAGRDLAIASYNETVLQALRQIASALENGKALQAQQQDVQQALALAEKTHKLALMGLRAGLSDHVQVISSELNLLAQQRRLIQVRARRLQAQVALVRAVGGGAEDAAGAAP